MVASRSTAWRAGFAHRPRLAGRDRAVRLPEGFWRSLLGDLETVARYHRNVYRRGPGDHWFWLGPISQDGQAKLRTSKAVGSRTIAAPVLGWHLSRGGLRRMPDGRLPVIRHTCDESACMNPAHWVLGTRADNMADYQDRKSDPLGPLADKRGPAGRARAIRDAILAARAHGPEAVGQAIRRAGDQGLPGVQDALTFG
jgi:hypothetical protein